MGNEVYGMSECTGAVTWSNDKAHVWGSVGWVLPGQECKVFKVSPDDVNVKEEVPFTKDMFNPSEEQQGELCYRGRNVMMGYMANPDLGEDHVAEITKKTNEAIDKEGWLHSGDKGCCDERGMFKITGRYKELLIGAGGENIAPVPIEDEIKKLCPAISNIMMIGDKMPYNCALISLKCKGATGDLPGSDKLDAESLEAAEAYGGGLTIASAAASEKFTKHITDVILATNKNTNVVPNNASKIGKWMLLPRDFSVDTEELTPTFKLKRSVVHKKYQESIDKLYAEKGPFVPMDSYPEFN